jgi:O-methyltransferase
VFQSIRQWNKRRRQKRRGTSQFIGSHGYPVDMGGDCVETIDRVKNYTMTTPERLNGLCEAVRYLTAACIEGDVVECGVWKGGSMMAVAEMLGRFGDHSRQLHLFDTFEGMSEPTEHDVSFRGDAAVATLESQREKDPEFQWCSSSLDEVRGHMRSTRYPSDKVHFVPGKVEDTIPGHAPEKIALLRLDTDWYESTRHELEHLFPRLTDGGVLIIDDYGHWQGARQAVDEYFANHGVAMLLNRLDYTGRIGIHHAEVRHTGQFNTMYTSPQRNAA